MDELLATDVSMKPHHSGPVLTDFGPVLADLGPFP